jgi:lipoprotein-anchoring transpeptidase ErfK/SrfK
MPKIVLPRSVKYVSFFIAVLLALLAILGVGITYAYQGKYYPGITVQGVHVGGMKKAEADASVSAAMNALNAKKINVALPDISQARNETSGEYPVQQVTTTAQSLGIKVDTNAALAQGWAEGHGSALLAWIKEVTHLFFIGSQSFTAQPVVDNDAITGFIATKVMAKATEPQPAKIVVTDALVRIDDQVPGLAIDGNMLNSQITKALTSSLDPEPISFRIPTNIVDAPITRTVVQPIADQLSALADTKVSLKADGVNLVPNRGDLLKWYVPVQDDTGKVNLSLNSDGIAAYLQKNKLIDQTKSLATVSTAALAWLSANQQSAQLALVLKPVAITTVGSYQAGLFDGKYVFINLAEQKGYLIEGTAVDKVYRVSSGKSSTPTPHGTFHILSKTPRAFSGLYGLYMPWWENFTGTADNGDVLAAGGYGLHELPEWPNGYKEGVGHLGTPVSDGCVRFGVGDAKEVYDWTSIGTPVVIQ